MSFLKPKVPDPIPRDFLPPNASEPAKGLVKPIDPFALNKKKNASMGTQQLVVPLLSASYLNAPK